MRYCINIDIDGLESREITDIGGITSSTVVVFLNESVNKQLNKYYLGVYRLIQQSNRVMLIILGDTSKISKHISMLMYSYNQNDIYKLSEDFDLNGLTKAYIAVLEEQTPDDIDIELFIGSDVISYGKTPILLAQMLDIVNQGNTDTPLDKLIRDNATVLESALGTLSYTKAVTEKVNLGAFKSKLNNTLDKLATADATIKELEGKLEGTRSDYESLKANREVQLKELKDANAKIDNLEKKLNQGAIIREYISVNTKLLQCKVKVVIYYKEISRINYISSFISEFYNYLTKILKKRTKLIIYDNPHSFLGVYKPIQAITSAEYVTNRQSITQKMDKMVLVEPNPSILQDVLTNDTYEIVLVYDRLKQETDIVTGNNVYKYYIVNSIKDINEIKKKNAINMTNVITNIGVDRNALTISEIEGYKTKADSPKLSAYMSMLNTGTDTRAVFDIITEDTNINML